MNKSALLYDLLGFQLVRSHQRCVLGERGKAASLFFHRGLSVIIAVLLTRSSVFSGRQAFVIHLVPLVFRVLSGVKFLSSRARCSVFFQATKIRG